MQCVRQRIGEGREQHAGVGRLPKVMHGAMERDHGLAGAGRAGDPYRARKAALDDVPLRRMQENRPFLPRVIERGLEFLYVLDHAEAAQCIRMSERACPRRRRRRPIEHAGGDVLQQRLGGLRRQVVGQREEAIVVGRLHVGDPVLRHADREEIVAAELGEQWRARGRGRRQRDLDRLTKLECVLRRQPDCHLLDALANFHDLQGAGLRMRLDPAALGPAIGVVVMADIGEQQAAAGLVHDDADVAADPDRPEIRVLGIVDPVVLKPRPVRLGLQVEDRELHLLLLVAGKLPERGCEGVGEDGRH